MKTRVINLTYEIGLQLETLDCANCGLVFAIDTAFVARRRNDGNTFSCPNGHKNVFGTTEADRLREQVKQAEARAKRETARATHERDQRKAAEGSLRATKGHVTRLRKHVQAGLCPYGCRRHFDDLDRHIQSKHAGEQLPAETT